jgi:Domain of unknown function (DUF5615)
MQVQFLPRWCRGEHLLITTDKGFTQYHAVPHHGVLIIRLRRPNRHKMHQRIMQALRQFSDTAWSALLVIMWDVVQSTWRVRESH